jgi:hypothetical protein
MLKALVLTAFALAALTTAAKASTLPPPPMLTESPWNGDWVLSQTRNTQEIKDAAAKDYRFHLEPDGRIRWEIPSLNEVVEGRTDGRPMAIRRPGSSGLTLAVTVVAPRVLTYKVSRDGLLKGEGRMTLVDQGAAWVDISQPAGRPDLASEIIYVRPSKAAS